MSFVRSASIPSIMSMLSIVLDTLQPARYNARMTTSMPNLLFIMTDQQRYDALGANGNDVIHTPHLDALARGGANLQQYFTNCPVCVPSRCTMFTGRYPHAHRVRENHNLLECGREMHLFRVLKQAGYAIGYSGKNHLLEQAETANFDFWAGDVKDDSRITEWYANYRKSLAAEGKPEIWRAGAFHDFPIEATRTGKTAGAGMRFLRERDRTKPFALCVSFSDPHVPHLAPRKYEQLYPLDKLELHPWRAEEMADKPRRYHIKWRAQKADRADDAGRRHYMAVYYAMLSFVDEMVGSLLAELDAQGIANDTLVVFTTDHGDFCFEHNMCKKDLVLLDSLLHVPFLLRWPGRIAPQNLRETLVEQVDVMPTLLELMGIETPFGVQGRSFAACLRGERAAHKDAVCAEICPPWLYNPFADYAAMERHHGSWEATPINVIGDFTKSIREAHWRYIWYATGEEELYDHRADPHELHNLAGAPEYAGERTRLKLRLLEWCARSEDPLDPLSIRQLQAKYAGWKGGEPLPGAMAGPGWLEQRFERR